jgi:hypothetical protein
MPVKGNVRKMGAVDAQRCWNALDKTARIMLCELHAENVLIIFAASGASLDDWPCPE